LLAAVHFHVHFEQPYGVDVCFLDNQMITQQSANHANADKRRWTCLCRTVAVCIGCRTDSSFFIRSHCPSLRSRDFASACLPPLPSEVHQTDDPSCQRQNSSESCNGGLVFSVPQWASSALDASPFPLCDHCSLLHDMTHIRL